jgi:uncharacterized protein YkwD
LPGVDRLRSAPILILVVLGGLLAAPASSPAATRATECRGADDQITLETLNTAERTMLCLVNVYRSSQGVPSMTEDANLETAAGKHSRFMEKHHRFDHEAIGDGTPASRAEKAGFRCGGFPCVGENIAVSNFPDTSPQDMFDAWKASAGHNENMLDPAYLTAGMGFFVGPNYGTTGTQDFAIVSNGATSTAADMLTNPTCDSARASLHAAQAKVRKATKALASAVGPIERERARAKLKAATSKLEANAAAAGPACDLAY